jgi:ATP-binding cassette, subfamily B, bacterial
VAQFSLAATNIAFQYSQLLQFNTDVQALNDFEQPGKRVNSTVNYDSIPPEWNNILIKGISFSYSSARQSSSFDSGNAKGITNIHLDLRRGKRIALIGESGAGKSTLMSVLRGLCPPKEPPSIVVNGNNGYSWRALAEIITLLPQEPEIFENTVLYNITMGLSFPDHDIRKACEATRFIDVVNQLPAGFDTHINERGMNLSGGQRQRLALTRGLLASAYSSVVLLDEPTSSVDSSLEIEIYRNLFQWFGNKAVICSVHNIGLLKNFDYVYMMKDGMVINEGIPGAFSCAQ